MFLGRQREPALPLDRTENRGSSSYKLPLDVFPRKVLNCVFKYLDIPDLRSLACLGDPFSSATRPFIYRSIVYSEKADERVDTKIGDYNKYLHLVYTLIENPEWAKYVFHVRLEDPIGQRGKMWTVKLDEMLREDELRLMEGLAQTTLLDSLVRLLDLTTNLHSLHVPTLTIKQLSLLKLSSVRELTIAIAEGDSIDDFVGIDLRNVTSLCVRFEKGTDSLLTKMSKHLRKIGALERLEALELNYRQREFNELLSPTWYAFFHPHVELVLPNLRKLVLDHCQLGSKHEYFSRRLIQTVPLEQLESLTLGVYESSHKGLKHGSETHPTFLNHIAPQLRSLRHLVLKPSGNCLLCQVKSVVDFLHCYPHLHELCLFTNTLNSMNRQDLATALTGCTELRRLALCDEAIHMKLVNHLKRWFIYENLVKFEAYNHFECEILQQVESPQFERYASKSFEAFTTANSSLMILFWRTFLPHVRADALIRGLSANEFKLYGYNFRVDRDQNLVQMYTGSKFGYQNLLYY
ncbi:hypothetical protein KL930_000021 [Ogataea haglerorum]|nr:hypothetical protein KL950_003408 [Ogataea haglerorum]KAG7761025.1 hypothetical protein KL947_000996 [Ogataea haglerorum]KAG7777958.1 hypothetical protein KL922_002776 [Ogataea haglerorum]KAG7782687.1 hypothetical protein KL930_000021 [Ogataea haglerorum]